MSLPIEFGGNPNEVLQRAYGSYIGCQDAIKAAVDSQSELLRQYDAPGMDRAVAICFWGRSGSWLLQSYLDCHDDVVILPKNGSHLIYPFFLEFESLSLWEKLIAYPTYSEANEGLDGALLAGPYAVDPVRYYAAVQALFEIYCDQPASWLNARARFVQFLHAAYAVATGRRPLSPKPLIVYVQHWTNDEMAGRFIDDFPKGRFIHTIRDPITSLDSWYDRQVDLQTFLMEVRPDLAMHFLGRISAYYFDPAGQTVRSLLRWDRAHAGMDTRTGAIRFEDLHLSPESTMRRLAAWLGIVYRPTLLESTFNGVPYVYESGGATWVGANPKNARRRSLRLNSVDRLLMFTLLQDNFLEWKYESPNVSRSKWSRLCIIGLLLLVPMKMELLNARLVVQRQVIPALRKGRIGYALGAPIYLIMRRCVMIAFIAMQTRLRLTGKRLLLKPI
jgi:hypothetical protein